MKNNMSLDVLLIHPNAATKIYQDLSKDFSAIEPPIWAAMIARFLLNKGVNTAILDCEALGLSVDDAYQAVKAFDPKIIGMVVYGQQPSASSQNMFGAEMLMNKLRDLDKIRIYIGPTPTALPNIIVGRDTDCFVCAGEGPHTMYALANIKDRHSITELEKVPGLCYFDPVKKEVIKNRQAPLIMDLDGEMPSMAWELLPIEKYRTANWHGWTNIEQYKNTPFAAIYTSLGCPFRCSFCMINSPFNQGDNKNNRIRTWSVAKVMETLDALADRGVTNLKLADEMFVLQPRHFLGICEAIAKRGHKFNIWAYARIDTVREEYLVALKRAGVNWIGLGIESANPVIRQEVTKGKFQELNIREIVKKIDSFDICATGNYIFGLPNDTAETMQQTLDLALDLETGYVNFYCAMAYPGSQLHMEISKTNPMLLPENNGIGWLGYSQHSYETFCLPTASLTNVEVLRFREKAFETYFSDARFLDRMTKRFGSNFKQEIEKMKKIKLKRKLLE